MAEKRFQLGDYWLSQRPGSPTWFRTWFDNETRQTRRAALGTTDAAEAEKLLTAWYVKNVVRPESTGEAMSLYECVQSYYHNHAVTVRAGTRIKYQLGHIEPFFKGMTVAEACKPQTMERFVDVMKAKGLKASYINNTIFIIKAAVNRAWKRGEIERQYHIQAIKNGSKEPMGEPLEPGQWASMLEVASPHIARMIMLGLGTGARPEAVCELTWDRVDLKAGLITLNPREREQTKKHRPIVRIPPTLREWLEGEERDGEYVVQFRGQPTRRYHDSWKRTRTKAEIGERVTAYSMRHTVARWCRSEGVPAWSVSAQLGHSAGGRTSITERYAPYSPDYLAEPCAAIDRLLQAVAAART